MEQTNKFERFSLHLQLYFLRALLERHLEPLARPQPLAIIVEQDRNRAQCQADESQQTVAPALNNR